MASLEPFLRFWRALDGLFDAEDRTGWGAVVSDARYPAVQEANYARVETTRPVGLDEIETALLPRISGAGCRREHVVVFVPEAQTDLLVEASTRGDRIVWDLVMANTGPAEARAGDPVEEVEDLGARFWAGHRASLGLFDVSDEAMLDQLAAIEREVLIPAGRRWFVIPGADRAPVAFSALLVLEGIAFIDHVVTLPEARRHGHATALTRRMLAEARAAGAEATYLLAEPRGTAAGLYGRLGFERVTQIASWIAPVERIRRSSP